MRSAVVATKAGMRDGVHTQHASASSCVVQAFGRAWDKSRQHLSASCSRARKLLRILSLLGSWRGVPGGLALGVAAAGSSADLPVMLPLDRPYRGASSEACCLELCAAALLAPALGVLLAAAAGSSRLGCSCCSEPTALLGRDLLAGLWSSGCLTLAGARGSTSGSGSRPEPTRLAGSALGEATGSSSGCQLCVAGLLTSLALGVPAAGSSCSCAKACGLAWAARGVTAAGWPSGCRSSGSSSLKLPGSLLLPLGVLACVLELRLEFSCSAGCAGKSWAALTALGLRCTCGCSGSLGRSCALG